MEEFTAPGQQDIYWLKMSTFSQNYWTIDMEVNHVFFDFDTPVPINSVAKGVVLDSGTSFIITPTEDYDNIINYLSYDLGFQFDDVSESTDVKQTYCTEADYERFPDLWFKINDTNFKLPKTSYLYRLAEQDTCYLLLIAKNFFSTPMYILGNIFLHNYYTIYDLENELIGMATAKQVNYKIGEREMMQQIKDKNQPKLISVSDAP